MADQNNPWSTASMADSATQSVDAWGALMTASTDGGGTDWLTSTSAPDVEHFNIFDPFYKALIPLDNQVIRRIDQVATYFRPVLQGARVPVGYILDGFQQLLLGIPVPVAIITFALIAWQISGIGVGVATLASLIAIDAIDTRSQAMVTLVLALTTLLFYIVIGLPLGIRLTRSPRVTRIIRSLLDAVQTTPAFVYLVSTVILLGIGNVPSAAVMIIFALSPITRLIVLGINQVPADLTRASRSFGANSRQTLFKAQLPLVIPITVAGVSQVLMLALSMVVIASAIIVGGLGRMVFRGIGRLGMGLATVGGVGIVILAIILNRLMQTAECDSCSRDDRR